MLTFQIYTQVMSAFHFTSYKECVHSPLKVLLHNEDMGGFILCILTKWHAWLNYALLGGRVTLDIFLKGLPYKNVLTI